MRPLMTIIAALLLIACLNVQLAVQVADPFAPEPTPTQEVGYTVIGYVRPKNSLLNVRGCRSTSCPINTTLYPGDRLPVVDMTDPALVDTDAEWWYVVMADQGYAWVSKFASVYEGVR